MPEIDWVITPRERWGTAYEAAASYINVEIDTVNSIQYPYATFQSLDHTPVRNNVMDWESALLEGAPQEPPSPFAPQEPPSPFDERGNRTARRLRQLNRGRTYPESRSTSYTLPRYSPIQHPKVGEVFMKIDSEAKAEIVATIPVPGWLQNDVFYIKGVETYRHSNSYKAARVLYWTNRVKVLWSRYLMDLPIDKWFREGYVGIQRDAKKITFSGTTPAAHGTYEEYVESSVTSVSAQALEQLLSSVQIRRGYMIQNGSDFIALMPNPTAPEKYRQRLLNILESAKRHVNGVNTVNGYRMLYEGPQVAAFLRLIEELNASFSTYARTARGNPVSDERPVERHDTSAQFFKFWRNRYDVFVSDVDMQSIETLSIAAHGTKSSRPWGIEIEAGGARGVYAPNNSWERKDDGSLRSAYETLYISEDDCANDHEEFMTDDDGNEVYNPAYMEPRYCESHGMMEGDYEDTAEFVSPILHYFHSNGLNKLLAELREEPQNDSAGVHVHVDVADLTPRQVGGLVFAYEFIEPLIEAAYRRNVRDYCRVRPERETLTILNQSKKARWKSPRDNEITGYVRGSWGEQGYLEPGQRYVSVNLCALSAHGTVEFRAMGPVYEYEHLIKWAHFCREMVNLAKANVPAKAWTGVRSFGDVRALFAKYGSETANTIFEDMTSVLAVSTPEMAAV